MQTEDCDERSLQVDLLCRGRTLPVACRVASRKSSSFDISLMHCGADRQSAWQFVAALLASPALAVLIPTQRHGDVAAEVIAELPHLTGNLMHDAHTAIFMHEYGTARIYTRDTDFS